MKKLLFFTLITFFFLDLSTSAQILQVPGRVVGMGTNITVSVYYTYNDEIEGFELQSLSNFELRYFLIGDIFLQNGWEYTQYLENNYLKVAAVGNGIKVDQHELGKLGLFIYNVSDGNNLSTSVFDGQTWAVVSTYFTVLDLPHSRYGDLIYDNKLNINDAIEMWNIVGTTPINDTLRVISDLDGEGGPVGTWDVILLLNKIVDPNTWWPIFDYSSAKGEVGPVSAVWQQMSNGKWGLFSGEKIINGDLITESPDNLSHLDEGGWLKKMDNKVYFITPDITKHTLLNLFGPILISDQPINLSGKVNEGRRIVISSIITDIDDEKTIPQEFSLKQNYPNPFNPTTTIKFALSEASFVTLKIYNMLGQEIRTLVNEQKNAGTFNVQWKGDNDFGNKVSSGTYIYRITAGNFMQTKKMILMK